MKKYLLIWITLCITVPELVKCQQVTFSPSRGFYSAPFNLTLTSTIGGTIRYTTDGSAPTASVGTVYSAPVSITNTSEVRAIAINGATVTPVITHSFIFLESVIRQPATIPGWPNNIYDLGLPGTTAVHDYAMDQNVVNDPAYSGVIIEAMKDIPTMSVVMNKDEFQTMYDGDLQFPASVEIINSKNPAANEQFNCGIESHSHLRLKRSMRLVIDNNYFPSGLKSNIFKYAPLNGSNATNTFTKSKIVLRAGNNRSWARNWNPDRTCYTRDQWYRDAMIDVSGVGSHGTFVHLYINGLYWGLFNPCERLDAGFEAAYMGGTYDDWLNYSEDGVRSGDATRFNYLTTTLVNKDMTVPANYAEMQTYLDVNNFSDYLITTWITGMTDWPLNNFSGGNRNNPAGPNLFFAWDCEWSWDNLGVNTPNNGAWVNPAFRNDQTGNGVVTNLWHSLRRNSDFMAVFADRVYRSCFNNGRLTDAVSSARWLTLNNFISKAIIGESARWGDAVGDGITRTKNGYWQPEVTRVDGLMHGNVDRFITALRAQGYYPTLDAPAFSRESGIRTSGNQLTITNPNSLGSIYYTTNGEDPRLPGGGLSPNALLYSGVIDLAVDETIKARIQDGTAWSSLHEGKYYAANLKINEFMASNTATIKDEFGVFEDWIEIYNNGSEPVDIGGMYITDLLSNPTQRRIPTTDPTVTTIPAHGYKLLWADNESAQGPLHVDIKLSASGEAIGIAIMDGSTPVYLDQLTFGPQANDISTGRFPDGSAQMRTFSSPTPNSSNIVPRQFVGIYINEYSTNNVGGLVDNAGEHDKWIEVYNSNAQPVNIGGMYVTNNLANQTLYQIPANQAAATTIPANGYAILWADNQPAQGALHLGFVLSASGQIGLYERPGNDVLLVDALNYTPQSPDITTGRYPDASVNFKTFVSPTPGATNTLPAITGLKINEFLASNNLGLKDENGENDDWFEIYNSNSQPVDIGGLFVTDNLTSPKKWQIPTDRPDLTTIPAGGFKLLWADDQTVQGPLHTAIKLSGDGEQLGLSQVNGSVVTFLDSFTFGPQTSDISMGKLPDGVGDNVVLNQPTPGTTNVVAPPVNMLLTLVNAVTDLDIQTLNEGSTIVLSTTGRSLNIRANPTGTQGSVVFNLSGAQTRVDTENVAPYALFGDVNANYNEWFAGVGSYILTATAYSGANGSGTSGPTATIHFSVVQGTSSNQPPTVNAGNDQIIALPTNSVSLTGIANDPDGNIASYAWSLVSAVPSPSTPPTIVTPGNASTTINGLQQGTYVFRLTVQDNFSPSASVSDDITITVNPQSTGGGTTIRVNAGGTQQTTSLGVFAADANFTPTPGNTFSVSSSVDIANTTDDAIYRSERYGTNGVFNYAFPVVNGTYTVRLHFSENYHTAVGRRIFDITMEGVKVKDNYDVFAKAGAAFTATTETFQVNVTDGVLNMFFSSLAADGGVDQPKVSAIEILSSAPGNQSPVADAGSDQTITLPASSVTLNGSGNDPDGTITSYAWSLVSAVPAPTTPPVITSPGSASTSITGLQQGTYVFRLTVQDNNSASASGTDDVTITVNPQSTVGTTIRVNAGGSQQTTSLGVFTADANFSPTPGNVYSVTNAIAGTTDDAIYQSERYGTNGVFSYAFPVVNGSYTVRLHFSENYHTAVGRRIFDITMEGIKVKDNYDVFAKAGAAFTATTETFQVNVTDGVLNMNFSSLAADGGVDQPKVSAIEILSSAAGNQSPVADAGSDQTITLPVNSVTLNGSGIDPDGTITSYAWSLVSAVPNPTTPPTLTSPGSASTTVTGLQQGTYVFRLTVQDNNSAVASGTDDVTIIVNPQPTGGVTTLRVNAGGSQQTNSMGVFSADANFSPSPGNTYSVSSSIDIANTTDDAIYRSERYGTNGVFSYAFPVVNGTYTVRLHFSENYHTAVGRRIFDISMENVKVKDNFDVFAKAGAAFTATIETFQVTVTDGVLNMYFSSLAADGGVDQPKVSAIEILGNTSALAATGISVLERPTQDDLQKLTATVSPNPSAHSFVLRLNSTSTKKVSVRIFNAVGQLIEPQRVVAANSIILIGQNYLPGIYYVEMLHGGEKVMKKLVKQ